MTRAHELKTLPNYFESVWNGDKTFEIRFDDRGYQTGDNLILREHNPRHRCTCPLPEETGTRVEHLDACERYTGREVVATIGYLMASTPPRGGQPGFQGRGYVVLALVAGQRNDAICSRLTDPPAPPRRTTTRTGPSPFAKVAAAAMARKGDNNGVVI